MISVQTVVDRMTSVLDAEGSDRYLFDQDFKPAINSSVEWLVAVFNAAFGQKKLSEENLIDLIRIRIFQASSFSRIHFDEVAIGEEIWSLLNVAPEPTVHPVTTPPALATPETSVYRGDLSFRDSKHSARRLTLEQWNENRENIFEAGNETLINKFKSYAYLSNIDYNSTGYSSGGPEIEIRPTVPAQFVAVGYIRYPAEITAITEDIGFPSSLLVLLFQKALNFVAYKQGDQTTLFAVTERDIANLVRLMT